MKIILSSGVEIIVKNKAKEQQLLKVLMAEETTKEETTKEETTKNYRKYKAVMGRKTWTPSEDATLRDFPVLPAHRRLELARQWGRTPLAIGQRHWKLKHSQHSHEVQN